ncbi:hypothetical protein OAA06_00640 [bacterium]|nr:hypothetical protein [bacterium]
MKLALIIIATTISFLFANAQETVNIRGIDIPLNEIPFGRSYHIKENKLKSAKADTSKSKPHTAFASRHKNRIAVALTQDVVRKNKEKNTESVLETTFEMYDKKGKLKWSIQKDNYNPGIGSISEETGRSNFVWYSSTQYNDNRILGLYDSNGNEVFTDEYVKDRTYTDENKDIIFYTKDPFISSNNNDANTLFCYNAITKSKWSKKFDSPKVFRISGVANDGSYVLCGFVARDSNDGSILYCLNNKGEILWTKEFNDNLGHYKFSNSTNYFIRTIGYAELYNSKGEMLFRKNKELIMGYSCKPNQGNFVKNDEGIIAINSVIGRDKSILAFYNLKGEILDSVIVPYEGAYYIELYPDNKYHIFVDSKLVLEYTRTWH